MSSTKESSHGSRLTLGDYEFGMGLSFGTILAIVTITCASWKCYFHMRAARRSSIATTASTKTTIGLDEAALLALPKLLYSEAKPRERDPIASGCSICLADYKDNDMLRQLPSCGHLFHVDCVDPWLRLQATCPICRDPPLWGGIHRRQLQ